MSYLSPIEESLAQATPHPNEEFVTDLRGRALQAFDRYHQPTAPTTKIPRRRLIWGWASAVSFLILVGFFFTPPGRALAQAILQFSLFTFTDEPTSAEQTLTATPEQTYELVPVQADLTNASEQAGFQVYYPAFVPEGYRPFNPTNPIEVLFNSQDKVLNVNAMFEHAESRKILSFTQIPYDFDGDIPPINFGTGEATPEPVIISGNEGVWLQDFTWGTKLDENGNPVGVPYNLLIWQMTTENGNTFQFWLGSEEQLPFEIMQQIAESIAP